MWGFDQLRDDRLVVLHGTFKLFSFLPQFVVSLILQPHHLMSWLLLLYHVDHSLFLITKDIFKVTDLLALTVRNLVHDASSSLFDHLLLLIPLGHRFWLEGDIALWGTQLDLLGPYRHAWTTGWHLSGGAGRIPVLQVHLRLGLLLTKFLSKLEILRSG